MTSCSKNIDPTMPLCLCGLIVLAVIPMGCRSHAHEDLYVDQLTSEIRFLEDQLYQVDYENKILREKVNRLKRLQADGSKDNDESFLNIDREDMEKRLRSLQRDRTESQSSNSLESTDVPEVELGSPEINVPEIKIEPGDILPPDDSSLVPPEIDTGELLPPGDAGAEHRHADEKVAVPANLKRLFSIPPGKLSKLTIMPVGTGWLFDSEQDASTELNPVALSLKLVGRDAAGRFVVPKQKLRITLYYQGNDQQMETVKTWTLTPQDLKVQTDAFDARVSLDVDLPDAEVFKVQCETTVDGKVVEATASLQSGAHVTQLWTPRAVDE